MDRIQPQPPPPRLRVVPGPGVNPLEAEKVEIVKQFFKDALREQAAARQREREREPMH